MGIRSQLRGFVRAFRSGAGTDRPKHSGDALARTAKHTLSPGGAKMPATHGSKIYEQIGEGADDYTKSFEGE